MRAVYFLSVAILGIVNVTFAQDKQGASEFGMFQTQEEYHQFMGSVKQSPETAGMVDLINDVVLGRPVGSTRKQYGGGESTLGMLSDPEIRADLEIVDDQYQDLQRLNSEIQNRASQKLRGLDLSDRENLVKQINEIREQTERELGSLLLPHQTKRLEQIKAQSQLRRRSLADLITADPLRTELDITEGQSQELKALERDIEAELAQQIAELQRKARERLLSKLTLGQREKVAEIFGDAFEFRKGNTLDSSQNRQSIKQERRSK